MNRDEKTTAMSHFRWAPGRTREVFDTYEVQHASPYIDPHFF